LRDWLAHRGSRSHRYDLVASVSWEEKRLADTELDRYRSESGNLDPAAISAAGNCCVIKSLLATMSAAGRAVANVRNRQAPSIRPLTASD